MSESVTVRLPAELREQLTARATSDRKSRSAVIVEALQVYLSDDNREAYQRKCDEACRLINEADGDDPDLWEPP